MKHKRASWTALAAVGAAMAALTITASGIGAAGKPARAATVAAATATPAHGGTLKVALAKDITGLDPAALPQVSFIFADAVYNTLTVYDKTGKPQPELAQSWQLSSNKKSLVLNLRKNVKFQNGKPFTSTDVAFSMERLRSPEVQAEGGRASTLAAFVQNIATIKTPNSSTVKLTFRVPMPNIFDFFDELYIVDKATINGPKANTVANGTGPFSLKQWTPGQGYDLVRNPHYFKAGLPYLDDIDVKVVPSPATENLQFQAGQIDFAPTLNARDIQRLRSTNPSQVVIGCPSSVYYVGVNVKKSPLSNVLVRQALNHAIDRSRFVAQILAGQGTPLVQIWSPRSPAYNKSLNSLMNFDLAKAKSLLQKAHVSNLSIDMIVNANQPPLSQLAQIMQADLKSIGVTLTINVLEPAQFLATEAKGGYSGLSTGPYGKECLSPASILTSNKLNPLDNSENFSSPTYTKMVNTYLSATDPATKKKLETQISTFVINQSFVLPIATQEAAVAVGTKVNGFAGNRANGNYQLERVWLTK
jgi:peptide/nickel transport system substrate-binding protein